MAHAYTPGLRVSEQAIITKQRMLPILGQVTVKRGDIVSATQVVAVTHLPGNVQLINIAHQLGIEPSEVHGRLRVKIGDNVSEGQVLAENVGLFGLIRTQVTSKSSGTIESISAVTGQLILREPPKPLEVNSYITGIVTKVYDMEGVEIMTEGALIQGIIGVGGERHGRIKNLAHSPDAELKPGDIGEDCAGCVIIGGRRASLETYRRAEAVGASGLVVGSFNDSDLGAILGYDLGIAITGGENHLKTTLIMTEGFGDLTMAQRTYELLASLEGKEASISGATQIRAGVIRPEIIVANTDDTEIDESKSNSTTETAIGAKVRIIRQPFFGEIATIAALPSEPQVVESGAVVRVMEVTLANGNKHVLPRANVELIEE